MSGGPVEVILAGLTLRVPRYGSPEESRAIAETVNARLKAIEAGAHKVNTQAFALQAAYEFARELAELRDAVRQEESSLLDQVNDLSNRIDAFREEIESATDADAEARN